MTHPGAAFLLVVGIAAAQSRSETQPAFEVDQSSRFHAAHMVAEWRVGSIWDHGQTGPPEDRLSEIIL